MKMYKLRGSGRLRLMKSVTSVEYVRNRAAEDLLEMQGCGVMLQKLLDKTGLFLTESQFCFVSGMIRTRTCSDKCSPYEEPVVFILKERLGARNNFVCI